MPRSGRPSHRLRPNRSAVRSGDGVHALRKGGGQAPDTFDQLGLARDAEADPSIIGRGWPRLVRGRRTSPEYRARLVPGNDQERFPWYRGPPLRGRTAKQTSRLSASSTKPSRRAIQTDHREPAASCRASAGTCRSGPRDGHHKSRPQGPLPGICWVRLVVPKSWFPFKLTTGPTKSAGRTPKPSLIPGLKVLLKVLARMTVSPSGS